MKNKVIAMYLPQYHPTPHNNEWWGEGFTEWTNVAKARSLYPGHYQPKVPSDLGFYDLRIPEVRKKQAELAVEAGVYGFCYYHYWFGNGEQELELPFNQVVESGEPDFPFCLCWANETWSRKFWNKDGNVAEKKDLAVQKYLGVDDNIKHFNSLLEAFKDSRYIKVDGKLLFLIYRPLDFIGIQEFIKCWNSLALNAGLSSFYFVGVSFDVEKEYESIKALGFDGVFSCSAKRISKKNLKFLIDKFFRYTFGIPARYDFRTLYKHLIGHYEERDDVFPMIIPNWDHTPRSGRNGYIFTHTDPEVFGEHVDYVLNRIKDKPNDKKICFLKSWNEWGEGNYMEPDIKFGRGFIDSLRKSLNKFED